MRTTQYRWQESSPIQRIDIVQLKSGRLEAFIHAPDGAGEGDLQSVPSALHDKGYHAVVDTLDGQNVLRVTGFDNEDALFNALAGDSFLNSPPTKQEIGTEEKKGFVESVREKSVQMSGIAGMIGHACMAVCGVLERKKELVGTAAFYAASTSSYAIKGKGASEDAFAKLVEGMREHLDKEGVKIPTGDNFTAEELAKKGGVIENAKNFIDKHPLEVGNAIGTLGNVVLMAGNIKDMDAGRFLGGLTSLIAGLAIVLIPEKEKDAAKKASCVWPGMENGAEKPKNVMCVDPDEVQEKQGVFKRALNWLQEKPMQFSGAMFLASNSAFAYQAYQNQQVHNQRLVDFNEDIAEAREEGIKLDNADQRANELKREGQAVKFAYAQAAAYLTSTGFTSISSKTKVGDYSEQELLSKLCAYSANLLSGMEPDVRDAAVASMAEYLAEQPKVLETADELQAIIHEKVDHISKGPWMAKAAMDEVKQRHPVSEEALQV